MRKRFETLWAIRPEALFTVIRLMSREMTASYAQPAFGTATGNAVMLGTQWEASKPSTMGPKGNKVAVIPIQGVLTNDGPAYYGSNYQTIADAAEKAASDSDVRRIVLSVDSPGGEITGLPETAAVLARANTIKPVSAIVEGAAASAAYWLASQAGDITVTPSGEVGSVGVRMMHVDISKMLEDEGYKVTEMQSGLYKTERSPYKPLSEDAQADMQTRLDASHQEFIGAVAQGRGNRASQAIKDARFGEGRMLSANEALTHGLVDKIQPAREFHKAMTPAAGDDPPFGMSRRAAARARLELERAKFRLPG